MLVLSEGFSFEAKENEAFMKKVKENFKEANPVIYNIALDQSLKKYILETTKKSLPMLFEKGEIKEL